MPFDPLGTECSYSSHAKGLVAQTTVVWSPLAVVTLVANAHGRGILCGGAPPMHYAAVAERAPYPAVPVFPVGYLKAVVDHCFSRFRVAPLAVDIGHMAADRGRRDTSLDVHVHLAQRGNLRLEHIAETRHNVAIFARDIFVRTDAPRIIVNAHFVA